MANTFSQIAAVTGMNLRNIPQRWSSSMVAVLGIGGVTLVLVALLSIAAGFKVALEGSGSDDVAIIMRAGSTNELSGGFGADTVTVVSDAPGIKHDTTGGKNIPILSPELYVLVDGRMHGKDASTNLPLRGVSPMAPQVRKSFRMVEGKMFREGTNEIIVGDGVVKQYDGLDVGKKVRWGNVDWTVVGRFTDGGGIAESEAWGDTRVVQQAWRRGNSFQSVRAKLNNPESLKTLKDALSKDPRVRVGVQTERQFYADQQKLMSTIISTVGYALAFMMGIAALFAALNTLYNAVATRVREIATLRAMGFNGWAVMFSVLAEAMLLGAVGGLIGGLLAYLAFNGMHSSTMNWASFSQMTFAFTVTPELMLKGIVYGIILTFIAGILPGIRAARLPITAGLREL
ncbi:MAG TPA: FtsX-like permease family protein [Steroidobacteraceae bacterium]|jgi:putative ABC transport system permease protein|nr:FtsX-like permease family protein [Steroidobacteraceae bacterium]